MDRVNLCGGTIGRYEFVYEQYYDGQEEGSDERWTNRRIVQRERRWRIHEAGPKRLLARSWQCLKCRRRKLTNTGPVLWHRIMPSETYDLARSLICDPALRRLVCTEPPMYLAKIRQTTSPPILHITIARSPPFQIIIQTTNIVKFCKSTVQKYCVSYVELSK